eukprot:GILK01011092.1.p1 GENE.GILK01011092.1~~GILK01011092.1.p1  ORF type:complete len:813 (-),score=148.42 GILK01011092.1:74-2404(-)
MASSQLSTNADGNNHTKNNEGNNGNHMDNDEPYAQDVNMGTTDSQPSDKEISDRHKAQIAHASSLCVNIVTAVLAVFSTNNSRNGSDIGSHSGSTPSDILVAHLTDAIRLFCSVPTNDDLSMTGTHATVSPFDLRTVINQLPTVVTDSELNNELSAVEAQLNQLRSVVGSHLSSRDNCLQWKLPSSRDFQDRVMNIVPGLTCFCIYDTQEPYDELISAFKVRQGLPVTGSQHDAIRLNSCEEVDREEHVDWKACQTLDRIVLTLFDATRPIRSIDEINKEKEAAARKAEAVESKKTSSSSAAASQQNAFNRTQRRPVTSRPPAQHVDDYTATPTAPYPAGMHSAAPRPAGRGGKPGPSRAPSKHVDDFMANQKPAYPVIGTTAHTAAHTAHPVQASPPVAAAANTPSASGPISNRRDSGLAPHGHGSEPNYPHQAAASNLNQSGVGSAAGSTSFVASHPAPAAASSQFGYDPASPWPSQGYSQESIHPHRRGEPESTGAPHDPRFREHHLNQQPNPSAYVPEPMQGSHQYGVDSASPRITSAAPLGHPSQSSTVLPGVTMSTPLAGQVAAPAGGQVPFNPLLSLNLALNQTLGQRGVGLTNPLEAIQALTAMSGGQLPANLLSSVQLLTGLQQKGAFTLPQQQQQQPAVQQPHMHTTPSLVPQQQSPHPMYQPSLQLPVHPAQTGRPQTAYASASPLAAGTPTATAAPTAAGTGTAAGSMSPALLAAVLNPNASLSSQDIQQIVADPRSLQDPRIKQKLAKFLSQNPDLLNKIMKK